MSEQISFKSTGTYELKGRGHVFTAALDRDCQDFDWIVGQDVLIDGVSHRVSGVERFQHFPPWRKGEAIGLFVKYRE